MKNYAFLRSVALIGVVFGSLCMSGQAVGMEDQVVAKDPITTIQEYLNANKSTIFVDNSTIESASQDEVTGYAGMVYRAKFNFDTDYCQDKPTGSTFWLNRLEKEIVEKSNPLVYWLHYIEILKHAVIMELDVEGFKQLVALHRDQYETVVDFDPIIKEFIAESNEREEAEFKSVEDFASASDSFVQPADEDDMRPEVQAALDRAEADREKRSRAAIAAASAPSSPSAPSDLPATGSAAGAVVTTDGSATASTATTAAPTVVERIKTYCYSIITKPKVKVLAATLGLVAAATLGYWWSYLRNK